jgi:MYXO-CTERM domain-containing protein
MSKNSQFVRRLRIVAWLLAVCCVASVAAAAGRVQWKATTLKEIDKKYWRIDLSIFLGKKPDVAHLPMKFEFQPTVYFERTMVDGDKLIDRKVPLQDRQSMIETVDVGFLDPGTGELQTRTKFTFKVTRAQGYEAGEYMVTIRDGRGGGIIGTPTRVTFDGENEVIDRRSIVFSGEKKKKKQMKEVNKDGEIKDEKPEGDKGGEKAEGEGEGEGGEGEKSEGSGGEEAAGDTSGEGESGEGVDEGGDDSEGEVKEKPGGCGCRAAGDRSSGQVGLLLVTGLAAAVAFRRRRARAAA